MRRSRRFATAAAVAALLAMALAPGAVTAQTDEQPVNVLAEGLDGPRQLSPQRGNRVVVAESDTGTVSLVNLLTGRSTTVASDLFNPQGVDFAGNRVYIAVGEAEPGTEMPEDATGSALLVSTRAGVRVLADLLAYELEHNPDEQVQFVDGEPVDALSNPFAVLAQDDRILVADAGANAVLSVDPGSGEVDTFFVPPVITEGACEGLENNPGTTGCDSVPTGITEGPDGNLYVSTLGSELPDAARVYVLDQDGVLQEEIDGLTGVTGVAVGADGAVYASELFHGLPPEGPGPDTDPSAIGRLVRIAEDGSRTYAPLTMPTGLTFHRGRLLGSAWSVAGFLGMAEAGQVVHVHPDAFTESDA